MMGIALNQTKSHLTIFKPTICYCWCWRSRCSKLSIIVLLCNMHGCINILLNEINWIPSTTLSHVSVAKLVQFSSIFYFCKISWWKVICTPSRIHWHWYHRPFIFWKATGSQTYTLRVYRWDIKEFMYLDFKHRQKRETIHTFGCDPTTVKGSKCAIRKKNEFFYSKRRHGSKTSKMR